MLSNNGGFDVDLKKVQRSKFNVPSLNKENIRFLTFNFEPGTLND
jgi:hypothetical protein